MDEIDRIQELEDTRLAERLAAIQKELEKPAESIDCVECGFEIPEERRKLLPHATRCVDCQNAIERNRRLTR